jgi:SpoVK/Ycf46/Vps4 family AAA+-type ATPase
MKKWLLDRKRLFEMRDSVAAEIVPKGVLVMGISGCGKSLSIKAVASCFELPLYRIDMIEIFSGRHGKPEGAFAEACHMLESMAPAVVWFDEIEAGISTQAKEGELGRIFGFFLTWMREKARGLFVGATANRIDLLPAEMIRKGRFDEVFFVDLPLDDERLGCLPRPPPPTRHRRDQLQPRVSEEVHEGMDRRRDRAVRRLAITTRAFRTAR